MSPGQRPLHREPAAAEAATGMTSAEESVSKNKEGVPQWNGDPSLFQSYEEAALTWEQGVAVEKRYLCGPRLQGELQGPAKRLVIGKSPSWLSYNGGVAELMNHEVLEGQPRPTLDPGADRAPHEVLQKLQEAVERINARVHHPQGRNLLESPAEPVESAATVCEEDE